ncbi:MAG: CBS domain-containing protein [Vicinamibacterales bacterium]
MTVRDVMTANPTCCTKDTPLQDVAQMMVTCDCGEIPVVDSEKTRQPVGVVTDRDIVCRAVAEGRNPKDLKADAVMTSPAVTIAVDGSIDEVVKLMETHQIRRVPVVDQDGGICGIVSQADIARHEPGNETGELVREVSAK